MLVHDIIIVIQMIAFISVDAKKAFDVIFLLSTVNMVDDID